jgi:arginyl-tRNA synthetase
MSTRSGDFIPLEDLISEVGADAVRFFYNMRSVGASFDFDVDLAKKQNSDNPVYYVQYAYARVMSLFATANNKGINMPPETDESFEGDLSLLTLESEKKLISKLMAFLGVIEGCGKYCEPHRLSFYLSELAGLFHAYYNSTVIVDLQHLPLTAARLGLCRGVAIIIKYGLSLMGVSAPSRM